MVIGLDASRAVSSQPTGTEIYTTQLIEALIPLAAARGHRLRLYFNEPPSQEQFPNSEVLEEVNIPFPRLWTHVRLARELRSRSPDVFFTPAHVIPYSYKGTSVATVHDLGFRYFPEAHTWWQSRYLNWSTRHNVNRAACVVTDSNHSKEDLVREFGVKESKVDVIYPGTNPEIRKITNNSTLESAQHKYGITPPYLLYIGTLHPRKNLQRMIEAFIQSGVEHQLVIAGKAGWRWRPILETAFNNQSVDTNNLVLTGFVSDKDKPALISGAAAMLYPSLYEGFGFPILEANACGTPILCSNTSSLPEIAGEAALLVDPLNVSALSQGIQAITGSSELRHRLISSGYSNIQRFTWKTTASQVMSTIERAAG